MPPETWIAATEEQRRQDLPVTTCFNAAANLDRRARRCSPATMRRLRLRLERFLPVPKSCSHPASTNENESGRRQINASFSYVQLDSWTNMMASRGGSKWIELNMFALLVALGSVFITSVVGVYIWKHIGGKNATKKLVPDVDEVRVCDKYPLLQHAALERLWAQLVVRPLYHVCEHWA